VVKHVLVAAVLAVAADREILANNTAKRQAAMSLLPHTPPACCAWSLVSGIPCYHGTAVVLQIHGAMNMYKFIEQRYLSAPWKGMYAEAE
jgi:hypothetical protein